MKARKQKLKWERSWCEKLEIKKLKNLLNYKWPNRKVEQYRYKKKITSISKMKARRKTKVRDLEEKLEIMKLN